MSPSIAIPTGVLSAIAIATVLATSRASLRLLRPKGFPDGLADEHWTVQNRHFHEFAAYQNSSRFWSSMFLVFVLLAIDELCFGGSLELSAWMFLAVFIVGQFLPHFAVLGKVDRIREEWGRVEFDEKIPKLAFRLLFYAGLIPVIVAVFYVPTEFSPEAFLWIAVLLAIQIVWNGWGALSLARMVHWIEPADRETTRFVHELADEMGCNPPPHVIVCHFAMLNAFAYQAGNSVLITAPLLRYSSDEELRSVCAHEIGHLSESGIVPWIRIASPMVLLPMFFLRPLSSVLDSPTALFTVLVATLLLSRIYQRLQRSLEHRADGIASGAEQVTNNSVYAGALLKMYRENLVPATMQKFASRTHPDLFDRLSALAVEPDFSRPAPPRVALAAGLALLGILVGAAVFVAAWVAIYAIFGY